MLLRVTAVGVSVTEVERKADGQQSGKRNSDVECVVEVCDICGFVELRGSWLTYLVMGDGSVFFILLMPMVCCCFSSSWSRW